MRGHGGLFLKAAYACLILGNGSVILKFIPGQPHKSLFIVTLALTAYPVEFPEGDPIQQGLSGGLIFAGLGAFDERNSICDAAFKKRPPWPLQSNFEAPNCYTNRIFKIIH
jgi:hypothetical protein